ncbi:alpha-internexin [Anolis sagrei]|uniref:alpha-internexin n=1 Tax=Anolis sagrei TaxID=38937 RepID=UPI0035216AB5
MSFGSDAHYLSSSSSVSSSSYRKVFGEGTRYSSHRLGLPRGYGSPSAAAPPALPSLRLEALELSQASALGEELRLARTSEKEQLQGLNDRFAGYIEKVRQLEQRNRALEAELGAARQRAAEHPRLAELFQAELREARARLEGCEAARAEAALERERLAEEAERLRAAGEAEARARAEAEAALRTRQRESEGSALARQALERKLEALLDELAFVRQAHAEELAELQRPPPAPEPAHAHPPRPELASALKELRVQYEGLAARNLQAAEEWFRGKCATLSQQAARGAEAVRASRDEAGEYRRQLQARSLEAESLRGANEALERQLHDAEERHHAEALGLQDNVNQLESELRETKSEMARHLREYQDLLNVKMALDIEIAAYRKLLEGEETRFSTSSINMNPISNPIYSFQPRFFSSSVVSSSKMSSTLSSKKEEKEEARLASKMSSSQGGEAFAEVIEETITSTKKTERTNLEEGNMATPKI